jgi:hypothetical protein
MRLAPFSLVVACRLQMIGPPLIVKPIDSTLVSLWCKAPVNVPMTLMP